MTVEEAHHLAVNAYQSGRRAQAETLCRRILEANPSRAAAYLAMWRNWRAG